jgi:hypothetical protein
MLDELNDMGRAIQKKQGGPIPSYNADGGFIIDDTMLDAIKQVESGGDPNALSGVGAGGQYQIMPATAQQPGYGVTPISLEDRFDPNKSRTFAKQYLEGIMRANPDFTKDEVITAYHSGVGNVRKAKMGQEELGPRGQEYAGKVNAAMGEVPMVETAMSEVPMPEPRPVVFDDTPMESGFMSAQASTGDNEIPEPVDQDMYSGMNKREIQRFELGVDDDIIIDSDGSVQPVNPNRISEDIPTKLAEQFANTGNKELYDKQLSEYKQALKQDEAHKKFLADKKLGIDLESNSKIASQIENIDAQIEEAKKNEDDTLVQVLIKKKEKLNKEIVTTKPEDDKKIETVKNIIEETNTADYGEGKLSLDEVDDKWAKKNLTGEYEGDFGQYLINKAQEYGGPILDKSMEYFKNAFSSMFNGEELARMAMIYAGSRALGYSHNGSLNYSMKNYMKRVDANLAEAKKFSLTDKAREAYTEKSLKEYAKTGDRDVLERKASGTTMQQTSGSAYLRGIGKVQKYKDANGVEYVGIGGKYIPVTAVSQYLEPWDESVQGNKAIETKFSGYAEEALKVSNDKFGLGAGTKNKTTYDTRAKTNVKRIGQEANRAYREIIRRNSLSVNDTLAMQASISTAIDNYMNDLAAFKAAGSKGTQPQTLDAYITEQVRIPLTGLDVSLFGKTSTQNLNNLDDLVRSEMEIKDTRNPKFQNEYKETWNLYEQSWKGLDDKTRAVWEKRAVDKGKGWSGFSLWASRTSPNEKAESIKID